MKWLWAAAGAAIGYLLGAKAGRPRYEQIKSAAREWLRTPPMSDAVDAANTVVERGRTVVADKVSQTAAKVKEAAGTNTSVTN